MSSSESIRAAAARKWAARASAQRPYGRPSCGGSAMKRGMGRGSGGTAREGTSGVAQEGGGPFRRHDVEVHAGAELEAGEVREPRQEIDAPAEVLRPRGRRAHPHVERRHGAEHARE